MKNGIRIVCMTAIACAAMAGNIYAQNATDSLYEAALGDHAAQIKADALKHQGIRLGVGDTAPDFTLDDAQGQPVSLSSYRGKYVLVDFWASWCKPCRAENPNVLKAYNTYKDKNFTVLSVSLDGAGATANWTAAVKADELPWRQVNEPAGFKDGKGIVGLYDIHFIPQNFLVGPDGKVIFTDQRGDELQQKLAALFSH